MTAEQLLSGQFESGSQFSSAEVDVVTMKVSMRGSVEKVLWFQQKVQLSTTLKSSSSKTLRLVEVWWENIPHV